jgi:hypothetical protein
MEDNMWEMIPVKCYRKGVHSKAVMGSNQLTSHEVLATHCGIVVTAVRPRRIPPFQYCQEKEDHFFFIPREELLYFPGTASIICKVNYIILICIQIIL